MYRRSGEGAGANNRIVVIFLLTKHFASGSGGHVKLFYLHLRCGGSSKRNTCESKREFEHGNFPIGTDQSIEAERQVLKLSGPPRMSYGPQSTPHSATPMCSRSPVGKVLTSDVVGSTNSHLHTQLLYGISPVQATKLGHRRFSLEPRRTNKQKSTVGLDCQLQCI